MAMPRLLSEPVAAKRGIGSAGLQGYRETAAEPVPHVLWLTEGSPVEVRDGSSSGDEVFLPQSF